MSDKSSEYCFFLVSIAGGPPRRIVIRLHCQVTPKTCENFARLCAAPGRRTTRSHPVATYRGSIFHRVVPKFMVQGGDFDCFDGTGGYAVLDAETKTFPDENFTIPHDQAGVVSMANKGKNTNGSQFFITLQATPHLNKKHVAFGKITEGMDVVYAMATDVELEGERPTAMHKIVVVDCGLGKGRDDDVNSHSTGSDRRKSKKRKRKKEKKRKRRRRDDSHSADESETSRERKRRKKHRTRKHARSHRRSHSDSDS